jgi:gamma-glutamyltranspeptidase/glutathione hydrolase
MVPTIVFKDQKPFLIVGAPGGSVIISAVLQTILNVVDFGMSPVEAVAMSRIHCEGAIVHVEARLPEAVCRALQDMGHTVKQSPYSYDPTIARAQAILVQKGSWQGGSDPRGDGGVAVV